MDSTVKSNDFLRLIIPVEWTVLPLEITSGLRKEVIKMANKEVTSAKAASAAAKVLSNPNSSKAAKTAAASALTQRPNKK
ncbi:hypothetical protein G6L46_17370 [Agrobacterium rhizogenes]|nr:hypothetical protein [Rhizobium rhizogenes]NTF88904.1 hypothetical protein [Rhizobium rhizogenes]